MIKRKANKWPKKLSAITALLLAIVFLTITAVQAFHKHNFAEAKHDCDNTEYVYANEKCSVCDYIVHKQSQHGHFAYPPVIIVPVTKAVTLVNNPVAGVYKFTLQGYTNKGPPAASC